MDYKILSIQPAQPGWYARFKQTDNAVSESPVAVWAIIVDKDGQRITGFSESDGQGFITPDDEVINFDGWKYQRVHDHIG